MNIFVHTYITRISKNHFVTTCKIYFSADNLTGNKEILAIMVIKGCCFKKTL